MTKQTSLGRGSFLAGVGVAVAAVATPPAAGAATSDTVTRAQPRPVSPNVIAQAAGAETAPVADAQAPPSQSIEMRAVTDPFHVVNPGSDYMVDCLQKLGYEYVAAVPGSTFRGFQESVINYMPGNPEWLTATHEEISTAMAHGYAKASGKPMVTAVHGVVGVQHASMAVYNAYADRAPLLLVSASYADASIRISAPQWDHNAVDMLQMLRGYIKYDDQPGSLQHYAESLARAHGLAMTPPYGPVALVLEQNLQEAPISGPKPLMKPFVAVQPPAADPNAVAEIAKMLVAAENPIIIVDRTARTPEGVELLVQLAEALQAPVIDLLGRMNFPSNHHLWSQRNVVSAADLILALDVGDLFGVVAEVPDTLYQTVESKIKPGAKIVAIDSAYSFGEGNYQTKQRYVQVDYPVAADSQATLPSLIEAVQQSMPAARRAANADREARYRRTFALRRAADAQAAAIGWDDRPISVPRVVMELWKALKGQEWALVSGSFPQSNWPQRLWDFTKYYQYLGAAGAAGVGYLSSAALGAALAHRNDNIICVNIAGDGDYMMSPGSQWTAAHHKLPLLTIIHNNGAWHEELMTVQKMAARRGRHPERGSIGSVLYGPHIDFAKTASSFGVYAEGPITSAADLGPALARAVAVVRKGEPALLDVVMQGR